MPDINISTKEIPFLLGATGNLKVHAGVPNPTTKLTPTDDDLLSVTFGLAGDQDFALGAGNSVKLGVKAGANASLTPLWPTSSPSRLAVLADHGLADYFTTHRDDLILILNLGTNAGATAAGSFTYSFLTASATLEAGASAGYFYSRSYPADKSLQDILLNFFSGLRLPANIASAPSPGEVVRFEYSGYLKLGAELSVGYELKGAPSIDIGQLLLSEHYQLSIIGNLALGASVAGNFAVEVRSAADASGALMPDWARVIVRKKRASQFNIAADVSVDASSDLQGLPDTPNEFLGALLGVNAKNWLNMITQIEERVRQLSDLPTLQTELDTLARNFLSEWIGKASDKLSNTEFNSLLEKLQKVVKSYKTLDNSAITLFDRYFNMVSGDTGLLTEKLNELKALTSWDQFKGRVDPQLWAIVERLTGGDPLNWILGRIKIPGPGGTPIVPSLPELQKRAQQTLDLIQSDAHDEIRKVIALAKSKFPLDGFLNKLSTVDSIPKLKALSEDKLGGFIERLIGKGIGQLSNSELGQTITRLHKILDASRDFENKVYAKFKEAAKQSFSFKLHAEYSRASQRDALIDVMINLASDEGKALMRAAGHGDFQDILAGFRPGLVKINSGLLTHKVTKQSAFSVNVVGWHGGWHYQGMDRVIIDAEQQIKAEDNGAITVFTTIDMTKERERKRNGERVFTSFLLRFLGESHGVLAFDKANQQYLLDAITGMAASYGLSFDDPKTTAQELGYYLSFASDFGLTEGEGATLKDLRAVLPEKSPDDFGPISANYEVRYSEPGLRALFSAPTPDDQIREIMRKIVLANYIRESDSLAGIGWCYWTQGVFDIWKQGQADFTNHSSLEFKPIQASPFANLSAPNKVALNKNQLFVLSTLFFIEEKMVAGLQKLQTIIQGSATGAKKIQPHEFERALSKIGDALKDFDDFDEGVNTVFAVFDQLINLRTPAGQSRASSLSLVSQVDSDGTIREVTKMFIAQPEAADEELVAGAATP